MERNGKSFLAVVIASAMVFSTLVAAGAFVYTRKSQPSGGTISVTGSAKEQIRSDRAVWRCGYSAQATTLTEASAELKTHYANVRKFLIDNGISESEMTQQAISTYTLYVRDGYYDTNRIEGYRLSQIVEVQTDDVDKVFDVSKKITELIDKGVTIESYPAQYYYTKLADLKIDMIAKATKDALDRAEKVASNANAKIKGMKSSRVGVFQITPLYSNEISDYGINDTSSIDKEIMAVMNCEFKTK